MPEWTTACPDWRRRIVAGAPLIPCAPLYPDEADLAAQVFGSLRMVDAPGSPLMSEVVLPWANEFVRAIFGAYDPDTGRRRINEFMLLVSKKNGKSSIAAAIMLTALIRNWRASGEYIILAPTKEVADNSFKPIRDMVRADETLAAILHVQEHIRTVTNRNNSATLKVVAADSDTVSGKKAIGVFVDELHEFGKQAKAANMLLEATGGLASRPEGFVIYATTQSEDPPAGVFKQKLHYARRVRDGEVNDPSFLPLLYEFPPEMVKAGAHRDLENAYITNPNWGVSVDVEFIEKKHRQAQEDGEEAFRIFLAKHLNVEIGLALRSDRWAGAEFWERNAEPALSLDALIDQSEVIVTGIDGGGLDDLLGFAAIGRTPTGNWLHWGHAWAHPSVLERRKSEAPRLRDLAASGHLTLSEHIGDDVADVADLVLRIEASGKLADKGVGVDPVGIGSIHDALIEGELDPSRIVGVSQGWRLAGAITTTERRLAQGTLRHGGSPLMNWCVGNCKVEARANGKLITKAASGTAKIDPVMAMLNAVSLMSLNPEAVGGNLDLAINSPIHS